MGPADLVHRAILFLLLALASQGPQEDPAILYAHYPLWVLWGPVNLFVQADLLLLGTLVGLANLAGQALLLDPFALVAPSPHPPLLDLESQHLLAAPWDQADQVDLLLLGVLPFQECLHDPFLL